MQTARTFLSLYRFNRHFQCMKQRSAPPRYSQCFRYLRQGASNCVSINNNNNVSLSTLLPAIFFSCLRGFDSIYSLRYPVVTYTHRIELRVIASPPLSVFLVDCRSLLSSSLTFARTLCTRNVVAVIPVETRTKIL